MAELFETLEKTGALLSSAIDQYLDVCVAISSYPQLSFTGISRAFFDRAASELPLVTSYETKIKQAKAAIGFTINSSSPVSPINSLPSEILTRIFYTVNDTCGLKYDLGDSIPLPRYPDYLTHVCTRWRQVALDSLRLWTHIDLVRLSASNHGFRPRAETFVSRAGSYPLDIHIYEQSDCHTYDHQSMLGVIALTGPRTRSLELVSRYIPGSRSGQHPRILEHCLNSYLPGVLTMLELNELPDPGDEGTQSTHFIDSRDRPNHKIKWSDSLNVSAERLDTLLFSVTHLQLDGVYFPWTHQAYHGLVELHLLDSAEHGAVISGLELGGILAASPRLKLLHTEIMFVDDSPAGSLTQVAPIRLDDLEVLNLHSFSDENPHVMFSLVSTGPKPLRFSFTYNEYTEMGGSPRRWLVQIKEFFKRSNITELRLRYAVWPPRVGPENVLESLPNLRKLVLEGCTDYPHSVWSSFPPLPSDPLHLDIIYMIKCTIDLDKLAETLKHIRAEKVVFWGCEFPTDEAMPEYRKDGEEIKDELSAICPSFVWIDKNEPNPIEHWD